MKLEAILDNCKMSDRGAVRIIIAPAEALQHKVDDLIINRSSIRRYRRCLRAERTIKLRVAFQTGLLEIVAVRWDGTVKQQVDRFPVVISCGPNERLLGVAAFSKITVKEQVAFHLHITRLGISK